MNSKMSALKIMAIAAVGFASLTVHAAGPAPHWSYHGHGGPAHWAELDPAFEACAKGVSQSPVNIKKTEKADLPALGFVYGSVSPTIWNNGHTVQVNLPAGNSLKVGDQSYDLLQFHLHTPSEEAIGGKRAAMVAAAARMRARWRATLHTFASRMSSVSKIPSPRTTARSSAWMEGTAGSRRPW